ncbi:NeuD/PglB/VioB family sugar acetyltransferase [Thermochromatium tepidum]|nr:NeuD/PglB/VioB family sugar acetyltransferase [Thermochromatium tepidum]
MHECIIWGCAGHAMVLAETLAVRGARVIALFDQNPVTSVIDGVPVFHGLSGFEDWISSHPDPSRVTGFVAIGGHRGDDRLAIQQLFRDRGLRLATITHPLASVSPTASFGEGSQILAQAVVAAAARVGEACIINHKASLDHESILGDGGHLAPGATVCGCVNIGRNVMVGAGAVILPRLSIGNDVLIGAGAVVINDIPSGVVVVGNPAHIIRKSSQQKNR